MEGSALANRSEMLANEIVALASRREGLAKIPELCQAEVSDNTSKGYLTSQAVPAKVGAVCGAICGRL